MKLWTNVKKWLPGALIVALLCGLIGGAYAKYVKQDTLEGTVTIQASLGTIELLEHKVNRKTTGEYELTKTLLPIQDNPETTDVDESDLGNEYILLPGLDIPKDPFVQITGKSPIPVYIFVEIIDGLVASAVTYEVDLYDADTNPNGSWIQLSGVIGKNGGTVYAYKEQVTSNLGPVYILKGNTVTVGQKLNSMDTTDLGLTFYACMYEVSSVQKTEGETTLAHAENVYNQNKS